MRSWGPILKNRLMQFHGNGSGTVGVDYLEEVVTPRVNLAPPQALASLCAHVTLLKVVFWVFQPTES